MWTMAVNVATHTTGAVLATPADSLKGRISSGHRCSDDVATDAAMSGPEPRCGAAQTIGEYVPRGQAAGADAVRGFRTS